MIGSEIINKEKVAAVTAAFETMANNCLAYYADLNGGYENSATLRFCVESAIECIEASLTELTACLAEY